MFTMFTFICSVCFAIILIFYILYIVSLSYTIFLIMAPSFISRHSNHKQGRRSSECALGGLSQTSAYHKDWYYFAYWWASIQAFVIYRVGNFSHETLSLLCNIFFFLIKAFKMRRAISSHMEPFNPKLLNDYAVQTVYYLICAPTETHAQLWWITCFRAKKEIKA